MAVRERSLGPLYFASVKVNVKRVPVHTVGVTGMLPPFRAGRAVLLPVWWKRAIALGWWTPNPVSVEDEFEMDQWFAPKKLDLSGDDIKEWEPHGATHEAAEA
jgi:hypothetical protein